MSLRVVSCEPVTRMRNEGAEAVFKMKGTSLSLKAYECAEQYVRDEMKALRTK